MPTLQQKRLILNGRSTLLNGLVACWKLDEASGSRVDSVAGLALTDNDTVTQAAGQVGGAAQFTAANSEYLSCADSDAWNFTGSAFTLACWVYPDTLPNSAIIASRWSSGGNKEWFLQHTTGGSVRLALSSNGTTDPAANQDAVASAALATGVWHLVIAWYDTADSKAHIRVNNSTVNDATATHPGTSNQNIATILGALSGPNLFWNGRIDEFAVWRRALTSAEQAEHYANGLARRALL